MRVLLCAFVALLLAGCGSEQGGGDTAKQAKASSVLHHVPADTAYFFVSLQPLPDGLLDKSWALIGSSLPSYKQAMADVSETEADGLLQAAIVELDGKLNREGLEGMGVRYGGQSALYEYGLMPVWRMELSDPDAFRQHIERIEERAGKSFPKGTVGDQEYWYVGDESAQISFAVNGDTLVGTVMPSAAADQLVQKVFATQLPAQSLADSDLVPALHDEFDLLPMGTGYIDTRRVLDGLFAPDSVVAALMGEQGMTIEPACRTELGELATLVPRVVNGVRRAEGDEVEQFGLIAVEEQLAAKLAAISAPVSLFGDVEANSAFAVAFGLDLLKTKAFLQEQIDLLQGRDFACASFAEMQPQLGEAEATLNQPLPPFVANIRGFKLLLPELPDMSGGMPTNARAALSVQMANPEIVFNMAQMMVPQLAQLDVKPDGEPVPIPAEMLQGAGEGSFAMTSDGMALILGSDPEPLFSGMLGGEVPAEPPLLYLSYDSGALTELQDFGMQTAASFTDELDPAEIDAQQEASRAYAELVERQSLKLTLAAKGIRVDSITEFAD